MILTFTPGWASFTPKQIKRYPKDKSNNPIACLVGEEGSIFRLLRKAQTPGMI